MLLGTHSSVHGDHRTVAFKVLDLQAHLAVPEHKHTYLVLQQKTIFKINDEVLKIPPNFSGEAA